jgi:hypothetical protein
VELGSGDFYENMSRKPKCHQNWTKILATLHLDLVVCHCSESQRESSIAFPLQKLLCESAMLYYIYVACLLLCNFCSTVFLILVNI